MSELVNAKGLACPEPVILTQKALASHEDVTVLVDDATALENVKRLASTSGYLVETTGEPQGVFRIRIRKQQGSPTGSMPPPECACPETVVKAASGPTVFVVSSTVMGQGQDELGALLMKAFIHTAVELENRPDTMIFYNTGVKLAASGSGVIDDLKALEEKGVTILLCGTCVNFFELGDRIGAGSISNMYDIATALSKAGRIVKP